MNIIEVSNITKNYKVSKGKSSFQGLLSSLLKNEYSVVNALKGVSFNVKEGDICGVIGLNGAGKSTLIKILTGAMYPTSGSCVVNSKVPYKEREIYVDKIGVVFGQRSQLLWDLPVKHSFVILRHIYRIEKKKFEDNLEYFTKIMGIDKFIDTPVRMLSLGQRMRAEIVSTLLHDPKLLFLDEPTIGLDLIAKSTIRRAIKQLSEEKGTTVILTSHDLDDIDVLCDQLVVLDSGKVIHDGNKSDFINKFRSNKKIVVEVDGQLDLKQLSKNPLKEASIVADNTYSIEVDEQTQKLSEMLKELVNELPIVDLSIEENSLEDIVHSLYH
ncbi:ATP-binding cassette domain-containing protein [Reinekea sp. G2M2-21]|uniref:ABC transporter ATP-binding protein n=1 Tax=Reinekea sp. G2M2-21 TaxID=2788942 RepID=UPI0018ABC4D2|nr:ATP-binding cassette domain-containing protein [Reinekea sp. G2M2-21]